MSKELDELLFTIRQNPAFKELLASVGAPEIKPYRQSDKPDEHFADHIFRSGRRLQDASWRQFLIGEPTSQQE
jgi:hypothetical protein